jgi:hypothetical protein
MWKGLRYTSPPAPEEVRHDRMKQPGLTNPYIAEPGVVPDATSRDGSLSPKPAPLQQLAHSFPPSRLIAGQE